MFNFINTIFTFVIQYKKFFLMIPLILLAVFVILYIFKYVLKPAIILEFKDSQIVPKGTVVEFKGHKISKIHKIKLSDDLKKTYAYFRLKSMFMKLPRNIIATLRINKNTGKEFIQLQLPENPSKKKLRHNIVIKAESAPSLDAFIEEQLEKGTLDTVSGDFTETMTNINKTTRKIEQTVNQINSIIKDNRNNINITISALARTAQNIEKISKNINTITKDKKLKDNIIDITTNVESFTKNIDKITINIDRLTTSKELTRTMKSLEESMESLKYTSANLRNITKNVDCATRTLHVTFGKVNCLLDNANITTKNLYCLSNGAQIMLSKRFLLPRMMFGKPGKVFEEQRQNCICPY